MTIGQSCIVGMQGSLSDMKREKLELEVEERQREREREEKERR